MRPLFGCARFWSRPETVTIPLVPAAKVELEAYEATRGALKLVHYEAESECPSCEGIGVLGGPDPECPKCHGTGQTAFELCEACGLMPCDECDGTGLVLGERVMRVRIPPGIEDGDQVRVVGGGQGLLLDLAVRPEPNDPRLVRYLALAGMLAAAAVLVAYVLLS